MKRRSQVFTNNFGKVYDKIDKTENSKFRDVTSAEINKLICLCKSEQNISTWILGQTLLNIDKMTNSKIEIWQII